MVYLWRIFWSKTITSPMHMSPSHPHPCLPCLCTPSYDWTRTSTSSKQATRTSSNRTSTYWALDQYPSTDPLKTAPYLFYSMDGKVQNMLSATILYRCRYEVWDHWPAQSITKELRGYFKIPFPSVTLHEEDNQPPTDEKVLHRSDQYEWLSSSSSLELRLYSTLRFAMNSHNIWPDRSTMPRQTITSINEALNMHRHSLWRLLHLITSACDRAYSSTSREVWAAAYSQIGAWSTLKVKMSPSECCLLVSIPWKLSCAVCVVSRVFNPTANTLATNVRRHALMRKAS